MMNGGFLQLQTPDKLQSHIYSRVVAAKESSAVISTPGLFGLEKSAPGTAAQQSSLIVDTGKRELYVDVVEKVWASVSVEGTVIRAEVTGSIQVRCFLPGNPTLALSLNTSLSTLPQEGFSTGTRMSEVEFGSGVNVGDGGRKVSVMTVPGQEMTIARYTLAPDHPHLLPFTLTGSTAALTPSDAELKLKLVSNTGMGTVSPHVTFHVSAPPTTAAIMSRTSGPRDQTVTFSPDNKTIKWTISQFPGGSYAQAFIRLVDSGGNASVESGELDFEVSRWVCSGGLQSSSPRVKLPLPRLHAEVSQHSPVHCELECNIGEDGDYGNKVEDPVMGPLCVEFHMTHKSAPKVATTLYLKVEKMDTNTALPSLISTGTQLIFSWRDVNGAATDASADDKEIPASAAFSAPQSLHPSPHIAT
ncbi:AP-4 complex subunit mu-1 [Portunus trituberculatus]|uniref:AP-4 complex subunit mu-1 n=1 Tax=Portunus trituberculatus TaxID=210409 RepID=A0A5B7DE26_PORTR|nr:AP-4 complex subunit mu-1 [Portunus trituberculatus]